jgi:glycosyltransferase involved in cell wall biosynthesis
MRPMEAIDTTDDAGLPHVSVALCTFNGERHLREQLDSVLAQVGVALEVVALDDASHDGTLAILQDYAARDARVRVFANAENLGHVRSFEACMGLCSHALIAPCDQDDVWAPGKLARLVRAIASADMAYCDSLYIDDAGHSLGQRVSQDIGTMHAGRDPLRFVFQNTASGHALLVRRAVFERAVPFPAQLYHDWWLALMAANGRGVAYVDEALVQFRRHEHASSNMGGAAAKAGDEPTRMVKRYRSRNRRWIENLMYVFDALAQREGPLRERALAWHLALREAMAGRTLALWQVAWRSRASVPPWRGPRWCAAIWFYLRCARKAWKARREKGSAAIGGARH